MTDTSRTGTTSYRIDNPEEFARNMLRLFEEGGRAMSGLLERPDAKMSPFSAASEVTEAAKTVTDIFRIWMTDPAKLAEAQGALDALLCRSLEQLATPHDGRGRRADRRARSVRQPLQGSGVVDQPLFRFLEAGLSRDDALGGGRAAADRGPRRAHAPEGGLLFPPALERLLAVELPDDQPRGRARDACHQRARTSSRAWPISSTTWRSRAIF